MADPKLLIATQNPGKIAELRAMLDGLPVAVAGLDSIPAIGAVAETGATFAENARIKAATYAVRADTYALADDSGLEVAALGGRPGVHSARYAGENTAFSEKMRVLLGELDKLSSGDRSARFVCSVAFSAADGTILARSEGVCTGTIAHAPRGTGGFGYDPIFIPEGYDRTFAELPPEAKAQLSHRARAISKIIPYLRDFFEKMT